MDYIVCMCGQHTVNGCRSLFECRNTIECYHACFHVDWCVYVCMCIYVYAILNELTFTSCSHV